MFAIHKCRKAVGTNPESLIDNAKVLSLFTVLICLRPYYAFAIIYFAHVTHSFALATSVVAVAQITQALLEVPTGIISDRYGRVRCLQVGALASVMSVALYALGRGYALLLAGALLEGLWLALFSGNNTALLYDSAKEAGQQRQFHHYLAKMNTSVEIAGFVAAIAGGLITTRSFSILLWVSVLPQIAAALVSLRLAEPKRMIVRHTNAILHLKEAFMLYRTNPRLRTLSLADIVGGGVGGPMFNVLPAYYRQFLPVWAVGLMVSINYIQSAIGFRLSSWFMRLSKPIKILIAGEVYSRFLAIVALAFPTVLSSYIVAISAASYGPSEVAKQSLLHEEFTDRQRATLASFNSLVTSCLFAVFALFAGYLVDRMGATKSLLVCQVCLLPVLLIYVSMYRKPRSSDALRKKTLQAKL